MVAGDTITSVDAKAITSATDLTSALATRKPGDKVTVGWDDATGQHHTVVVTLASAPAS
jgi:S1-C subfamily serine protease